MGHTLCKSPPPGTTCNVIQILIKMSICYSDQSIQYYILHQESTVHCYNYNDIVDAFVRSFE